MNYTKNLISVVSLGLATLIAGVTAHAQVNTAAPESSGLLGKRYVELGFGYADVNHTSFDVYGTGVNVNLPVASNVDVSVEYAYDWVKHSSVDSNLLDAAVTTYFASGSF